MNEFLSTRQVIDILKVDRITIYRMQQDGRLKGIKIGQQWRFPRAEVERLLGAEPATPKAAAQPDPRAGFPTHCVQTVQDLFSEISSMSALMVDPDGNPLTQHTRACSFCQLIQSSPEGRSACQAAWRSAAQGSQRAGEAHTCHAGLEYVSTPVGENGSQAGMFLTGQYHKEPFDDAGAEAVLREVAAKYGIPFEDLQQASRQVPVLSPDQVANLRAWSLAVARSVESILHERVGFISRLNQIASLTQIL